LPNCDIRWIFIWKILTIHIQGVFLLHFKDPPWKRFLPNCEVFLRFIFVNYEFYTYLRLSTINATYNPHIFINKSAKN
jgi:hypothetical protein